MFSAFYVILKFYIKKVVLIISWNFRDEKN